MSPFQAKVDQVGFQFPLTDWGFLSWDSAPLHCKGSSGLLHIAPRDLGGKGDQYEHEAHAVCSDMSNKIPCHSELSCLLPASVKL